MTTGPSPSAPPAAAAPSSPWRAAFRRHVGPVPAGSLPWLDRLRADALERFLARGLPTPRDPGWAFTNLAALERTAFAPTPLASASTGCAVLDPVERALPGALRHVLVDGRHVASLPGEAPPPGLALRTLGEALREQPEGLRPLLEAQAAQGHPLTLLGLAFLGTGLVVQTSPGAAIDLPVVLQHVATKDVGPLASHLLLVVRAAPGSRLRVVESTSGLGAAADLTNALTVIEAGAGARVEHVRVQRDGVGSVHLARLEASLARDASLDAVALSFGAAVSRLETRVRLEGPGSEARLAGLYHVDGVRAADLVTQVEHRAPHATSRQLVKGVLDGEGRGAFRGRVVVAAGAAGTSAEQANHNLLLSGRAQADTQPELEIDADDVKCSHGATLGRLDETALFYLRSRGLDAEQARSLLVHAFAGEVLGRVGDAGLRAALDGVLATLLHEARSPGRAP